MFAIISVLRSRLLLPVFLALGAALLIQVVVAVALTRTTVAVLEDDLARAMQRDTGRLVDELAKAGDEVRGGLDSLSANMQAPLLLALAPKAIWGADVPVLTELARGAHRNPAVLFAVYLDAQGQRLTRHLNRQDARVRALMAKGDGALDKVLQALLAAPAYISPRQLLVPWAPISVRSFWGFYRFGGRGAGQA